MRIRRKRREWLSFDVGATTFAVRLDHGCPACGLWTAVALVPPEPGRRAGRVAAVSATPFRVTTLRLLRERLAQREGAAGDPAFAARTGARARPAVGAGGAVGGGDRPPLHPA